MARAGIYLLCPTSELYQLSSHHLVCRNHDHHLFLSQEITLVYYIDDIMQTGSSEQAAATILDTLARDFHVSWWEIDFTKSWGLGVFTSGV